MNIRFGPEICTDLSAAKQREWLETNGLGGFASCTVAGMNTRRYHGLLTAATKPPLGRFVLLSKLEETLIVNGRRYDLSTNQYPGAIHPRGFQFLREFRLDPFPVFTYEVDGVTVEKTVFMVHGENTTVVLYDLHGTQACALEVRPLIAFRDYHSTTRQNGALDPTVTEGKATVSVTPYAELPTLHLAHDADMLDTNGCWYSNFEYAVEQERGLDFLEDLYNPLTLVFHGSHAALIASTQVRAVEQVALLREREIRRRAAVRALSPVRDPFVEQLAAAADQYIVHRGQRKTIIAGYHWFGDWGRDTMIALPGLTIATGRAEIARDILAAFAGCVSDGMLPNRFPDAGETPEYNTVDATLWFFEAVRALLASTSDYSFVRTRLYETLKDIVSWHLRGTRYGIRVDSDGLLHAGVPGVQLTWMDSKIGDWVVTPRHGKPVEVQALWYSALQVMKDLSGRFGDEATQAFAQELADHTKRSFNDQFWNDEAGCLFDVVDSDSRDGSIRPNQIFAVSLTHSMLPAERARQVTEVVRRELLTPIGIRSLSPRDSRYRPTYAGGVRDRDSAYHQGTVWPWLMGPFITAYLKVHGARPDAFQQAAIWLGGLESHLRDSGLGHISEICDADPPYCPRGCVAQAWSVAEVLRAATEVRGALPLTVHAPMDGGPQHV